MDVTVKQAIKFGFWFSLGVTLYLLTLPLAILIIVGVVMASLGT